MGKQQIFVITHNGKPRAQGGHVLGYATATHVVSWQGRPCNTPLPELKPKEQRKPRDAVDFNRLPVAGSYYNQCCRCGNAGNPLRLMSTTSGIPRQVVVCDACGAKMKPFEPFRQFSWRY